MNQRYKFTEQDIEIISKARADNHNDRAEIRLFALQLRAEGMQAKEIAQIAGVSAPYVSQLVAKYFKGGIEAIICQCVEDFDAKYQVGDVVTFPIVYLYLLRRQYRQNYSQRGGKRHADLHGYFCQR